jgi:predicted ribosomally synthesized peptide with SipW-like signal peptide
MKFTKRKVFVTALVLCVFAIISMGTLAWFSASETVENKFWIASSEAAPTVKDFSIDVWENTPDGDRDQDGHKYEEILPGDVLKKESRVENTGDYPQYVRVTVTISDAEAWINALGTTFNVADVFDGFDATKWSHVWNNLIDATQIPEDLVYVMYYNEILDPGDVIEVFNNVVIPASLTRDDVVALEGNFSVKVKADAVQTTNVGVDASTSANDAAWTAFKTVEG